MIDIHLHKGVVGERAYKVSKFWRLGPHIFMNGGDLVFRLCYLRDNKGTRYAQISIKIKDQLDCGC